MHKMGLIRRQRRRRRDIGLPLVVHDLAIGNHPLDQGLLRCVASQLVG